MLWQQGGPCQRRPGTAQGGVLHSIELPLECRTLRTACGSPRWRMLRGSAGSATLRRTACPRRSEIPRNWGHMIGVLAMLSPDRCERRLRQQGSPPPGWPRRSRIRFDRAPASGFLTSQGQRVQSRLATRTARAPGTAEVSPGRRTRRRARIQRPCSPATATRALPMCD